MTNSVWAMQLDAPGKALLLVFALSAASRIARPVARSLRLWGLPH